MHEEDALKHLISALRKSGAPRATDASNYGYDVYLPNVIREFVIAERGQAGNRINPNDPVEIKVRELSPGFLAAAWELCRRGIIRPGIRTFGDQATDAGSAGCGYSITPFGRVWLSEARTDDFVPTEPERFGRLLAPYENRFGPGFHERAQQAIRCYGAHAYLACCAMCGAAAESILLAIAIAKTADEPLVLKDYRAANGRSKIEALILGKARQQLQTGLRAFTEPLKYWRDESAHGLASTLKDEHAYTALAMLLRFAQFSNDNWNELTH